MPIVRRSINLVKRLNKASLHHFLRTKGNPADCTCNRAMDRKCDIIPAATPDSLNAFKMIDTESDEPAYRKTRTIKRLYLERHHTSAARNRKRDQTKPLLPSDVLCRQKTFWVLPPDDGALLTSALLAIVGDYSGADALTKDEIWKQFFLFPQAKLVREGSKRMRKRLIDHDNVPAPNDSPVTGMSTKTFEEKKTGAACSLVRQGFFAKAVKVMERKDAKLPTDAAEMIKRLHPRSSLPFPPPLPQSPAVLTVCPQRLLLSLAKMARGKAPGPSGWTEDLLFQACKDSDELLLCLSAMVKDIINATVSFQIRNVLCAARFIPIYDPAANKIRPIAIGHSEGC